VRLLCLDIVRVVWRGRRRTDVTSPAHQLLLLQNNTASHEDDAQEEP